MDHPQRLTFLFERYLGGSCSPREVEELIHLLRAEGAEELLQTQMKSVWDRSGDRAEAAQVDWDKMLTGINRAANRTEPSLTSARRWTLVISAAAAFVVLATGAWWLSQQKTQMALAPATVSLKPQPLTANRVHTVHLPDGSSVTLNTSSKLDYPTAFTGKTRDVYLSGEGYFDIKPMAGQPFLVHTGKLTTRVLGTTFNIRAYPGDQAIVITVNKGKVQVLDDQKNLGTLVDNQQIHYLRNTDAIARETVNVQPIIAWRPKEIFYDNVRMEEVARALEQRFSVKVNFSNPAIRECRVTATFSPDDSLDEILTVLCTVTQNTYSIKGGSATLDGQGCP